MTQNDSTHHDWAFPWRKLKCAQKPTRLDKYFNLVFIQLFIYSRKKKGSNFISNFNLPSAILNVNVKLLVSCWYWRLRLSRNTRHRVRHRASERVEREFARGNAVSFLRRNTAWENQELSGISDHFIFNVASYPPTCCHKFGTKLQL